METPPHLAFARSLIGTPGSRWKIPTPALVVDLDALERNIAMMAERAGKAGLALRPHAKTHKSAFIAKRQIAAGAAGVCCAKLGEAEALAAEGVGSILVTTPSFGEQGAQRALALAARIANLRVTVDHPDGAENLARAAAAAGTAPLEVLIDVDVGLKRTGVADLQAAVSLAQRIAASPHLRLKGLQGYGGHWQHMAGAAARRAAVAEGMKTLATAAKALTANGLPVEVVTGGGTGTFMTDAALGILTEVQPGSYVFMDRQYRDSLGNDPEGAFAQSLLVQTSIISANHPEHVTVDGGLKAFATDAGAPRAATTGYEACTFAFFGDEYGRVLRPPGRDVPLGSRIEFVPPHCDPTVDRFDIYHLVSGDRLVDIVPIEARGRSQ